jgi:lysozyme
MEPLRDRLVREEGLRLFPYKDKKGIWTIGVGHNIEADPIMFKDLEMLKMRGITKEETYGLLDKDIRNHTAMLIDALPWAGDLDWPRKSVLIDIAFNCGVGIVGGSHGLLSMVNTLEHIKNRQWSDAAGHLRKTQWYKDVGPKRAEPLIMIMLTGE